MDLSWKITDTKDLEIYKEKIFEMYESSYKEIGLIDFGGWDGLKNYLNCSCYLLIGPDTKQEINGIILYWLSDYGNKISLVISSTPDIGKKYVIPKLIELLKTPGFYIELSDALEYLVRKEGLDNIKDNETIQKLIPQLKNEDIFDENDERRTKYPLNKNKNISSPSGSYIRVIKDIGEHRKALYGLPCLSKKFDNDTCNRKCLINGGKNRKNKTQHKKNKTQHKKNKTQHKKYMFKARRFK